MKTIGAPFIPKPTFVEPSHLELRERVFSDQKSHFGDGVAQRAPDLELNCSSQEFLSNATQQFQWSVQMDEQTCDAHNRWADEVSVRLNEYEEREQTTYNISFRFVEVFNEMLFKMHPQREMAQLSDVEADQSNAEAKKMLIKFEGVLKYLRRENYDMQGAIDSWESPLAVKEEAFKKAQMNSFVWTKLKTLPCDTAKQFETVYNLYKRLQSVYKNFESDGTSDYRLKYMTESIRFMAQLIKGELEVERNSTETDSAVHDLVTIFFNMVNLWKTNSLKTKGVIASLQDHVQQMKSNCKLNTRHLCITSFIFMLSSLKMFQKPRSQTNNDERGFKVHRIRLKRADCFSDEAYDLIELWKHMIESGVVELEGAYFVLDHQSDDKKGKKNAERKIAGALIYFISKTDKDAMRLQKIHLAWMLPREKREMFFEQMSPKFAELQRDNLSDVEDSQRRLRRREILRKKDSLVVNPRTVAEKKASQRDEELQEYLCTSEDWRGPTGKFDNQWLEEYVGGSWSMAEEKKRDPAKTDEAMWFEKMLDAQKHTMHIFWALQKNKSSDGCNKQAAKRTSKGKNKKKSRRKGTPKKNFFPSSSPRSAYQRNFCMASGGC